MIVTNLWRAVEGLPSVVDIGTRIPCEVPSPRPAFVPDVVIPLGVTSPALARSVQVEVELEDEVGVGVVAGLEVGDRASRDPEASTNCGAQTGEGPALAVFHRRVTSHPLG